MRDQAPLFEDGELAAAPEKVCTAALAIWNEIAPGPGWPTARFLTQSRRAALRRAVKDYGGLGGFREHLTKASRNDFLSGQVPKNGKHASWKPDLDWFLKPSSVIKILEQKFPANTGAAPAPQEKRIDPHAEDRAKLRNYRPGGFWLPGWGFRPEDSRCRMPAEVLQEWRERNRVTVKEHQAETREQRLAAMIISYRKVGKYSEANRLEDELAQIEGRPPVLVPAPDARDPDVVPSRGSQMAARPVTDVVPDYTEIPEGEPYEGEMGDG